MWQKLEVTAILPFYQSVRYLTLLAHYRHPYIAAYGLCNWANVI